MNILNNKFIKKSVSKLTRNKILFNTSFFMLLRVVVIIYTIIRIFLFDRYLGVANFGLFNIMLSIAPIALVFINASQSKSMYILYSYSLKKDYENLNIKINEQINEMRKYGLFSLLLVLLLMVISFFIFNSPGLSKITASLFILANTIEFLSFILVTPYVQWYLNSIYKNYIYDIISIIFSTIANLISFTIIILFGKSIIHFYDVSFSTGSTYITLVVTFILSIRFFVSNIILNLLRKKYMQWFKRERQIKTKLFNKNSRSYLFQQTAAVIASTSIPITLFILSSFVPLSTSIGGIYYSYFSFSSAISIISLVIASLRPYIAKIFNKNEKNSIMQLNLLLQKIAIFFSCFILLNYVILIPYILIYSNNYFSFTIAFLIGFNSVLFCIKGVDEDFIYLHGKPEKYLYLTLIEIVICIISLFIGFMVIFFIPELTNNIINLLYCILICEIITRASKLILNILYLNRIVYKISFLYYLKKYWRIYFLLIFFSLSLIISLCVDKDIIKENELFQKNLNINIFSKLNINNLINDNSSLINWKNIVYILLFLNIYYIIFNFIIFYLFDSENFNKLKLYLKKILKLQ